jgi:hypothetical protein
MHRVADFSGPKAVLRWAKEEIANFELAEKAFFDENKGDKFSELNAASRIVTFGVAFPDHVSDEVTRSCYRAISDLRNALDQAVFSASCILKPEGKIDKTAFPFADTQKELREALRTAHKGMRYPGVPVTLHPKLITFQPWWTAARDGTGNDLLRALNSVANPNKHLVLVQVDAGEANSFFGLAGHIVWIGNESRGDGKIELCKAIVGKPIKLDMDFHPKFCFRNAGILTGKPILPALNEMAAMVEGIIESIEAETIRLKG